MDSEIGIVCARCDRFALMGTPTCAECGASLALTSRTDDAQAAISSELPSEFPVDWEIPAEPDTVVNVTSPEPRVSAVPATQSFGPRRPLPSLDWEEPAAAMTLTVEQLIAQAQNFVCRSCSTTVPLEARFCGACGTAVPPEILGARAQLLAHHPLGKARFILIRGGGVVGAIYQLDAEHRIVDGHGHALFPDDAYPKLFYRNGVLVVRDDGSSDGVFARVKGSIEITPGDQFMAGDQILQLDVVPGAGDGRFRVTQLLPGGKLGIVRRARGQSMKIGRDDADLNFPDDLHVSASHCGIEERGEMCVLTDLNSRNGTYIRVKAERELADGEYLFIGKTLLRVEITGAE